MREIMSMILKNTTKMPHWTSFHM